MLVTGGTFVLSPANKWVRQSATRDGKETYTFEGSGARQCCNSTVNNSITLFDSHVSKNFYAFLLRTNGDEVGAHLGEGGVKLVDRCAECCNKHVDIALKGRPGGTQARSRGATLSRSQVCGMGPLPIMNPGSLPELPSRLCASRSTNLATAGSDAMMKDLGPKPAGRLCPSR
jgi:hypothetical protein